MWGLQKILFQAMEILIAPIKHTVTPFGGRTPMLVAICLAELLRIATTKRTQVTRYGEFTPLFTGYTLD